MNVDRVSEFTESADDEKKMPGSESESTEPCTAASRPVEKKLRICCACPDTRKIRDECVMHNGEEQCAVQIEAHKKCLRAEGFKVRLSPLPNCFALC